MRLLYFSDSIFIIFLNLTDPRRLVSHQHVNNLFCNILHIFLRLGQMHLLDNGVSLLFTEIVARPCREVVSRTNDSSSVTLRCASASRFFVGGRSWISSGIPSMSYFIVIKEVKDDMLCKNFFVL